MKPAKILVACAIGAMGLAAAQAQAAQVLVTFEGVITDLQSPELLPREMTGNRDVEIGNSWSHTTLYDTVLGPDVFPDDPFTGIFSDSGMQWMQLTFGSVSATTYDPAGFKNIEIVTEDPYIGWGHIGHSGNRTLATNFWGDDWVQISTGLPGGYLPTDQIPTTDVTYSLILDSAFQYSYYYAPFDDFARVFGTVRSVSFKVVPAPASLGLVSAVGLVGLRRRRR